ncbi:MAG: ribbon-helix-helix domain-containing protein [Thermodesulfobacteriota bacterium]|nr:ribbon-helix-helix domain-containing protein [Thermodesulfobacteriota bacterium]
MNTQKVAITIPKDLVAIIDVTSRQQGISRSKFISTLLRERILQKRNRHLQDAYNRIFSDESIRKEQLDTAQWFNNLGNQEGLEW